MNPRTESILRWQTRLSLGAVFGGLLLTAGTALVGLVGGSFDAFDGSVFPIGILLLVTGILLLLTVQPLRRGDIAITGHIIWSLILLFTAISAIGFVLFDDSRRDDAGVDLMLRTGTSGLLALAPVCFGLYFAFLPKTHLALKAIAMFLLLGVALAVLAGLIAIWTDGRGEPIIPRRWFEDFMGVSILIGIASMIGLMITHSIARAFSRKQRANPESLGRRVRLRLTCPRCANEAEMPTGFSKCASCGGVLEIDVEEPRCACGYLLFQLVGDRCPECGRDVPDDQRWTPSTAPATLEGHIT